ncbi:hypothetical protein LTR95_007147 [Oleoguttula sp. CCFEE 5521]
MANQCHTAQRGHCCFLEIPPELRLEIYKYLDDPRTNKAEYTILLDKRGKWRMARKRSHCALLFVSRLIHRECQPLFELAKHCAIKIDIQNFRSCTNKELALMFNRQHQHLLLDSPQILNAQEISVHINSPKAGGHRMKELLRSAVDETFQCIAGAEQLQCMEVLVRIRNDDMCDRICRAISKRDYSSQCKVRVGRQQLQRSTRAMLDELAAYARFKPNAGI